MRQSKPIRVFWSPLSKRFYASRAYRMAGTEVAIITGEKFDVTDDIASAVIENEIVFTLEQAHGIATEGEK